MPSFLIMRASPLCVQDDRFDCATCMLALFARHVCMQMHRGVADRVTIEMGRGHMWRLGSSFFTASFKKACITKGVEKAFQRCLETQREAVWHKRGPAGDDGRDRLGSGLASSTLQRWEASHMHWCKDGKLHTCIGAKMLGCYLGSYPHKNVRIRPVLINLVGQ